MVTSGYGPCMAWHGCILIVWWNNSPDTTGTPCDARMGFVRGQHGNLRCFSYPTGPVRGPCMTRMGAVRRPYGHVRELAQPQWAKIPHGRRIWLYGAHTVPAQAVYGLSGRRVDVRFLLKTVREQPVRGQGVWCDWGIRQIFSGMIKHTFGLYVCVNTLCIPAQINAICAIQPKNTTLAAFRQPYFINPFLIFSCDQAALGTPLSVRPSVCLSVCHVFFTMFLSPYHHEIFRSYYQWQKWCPCKRSRS